jgi:glycosyltransferase involved in cell wall biosynthesis
MSLNAEVSVIIPTFNRSRTIRAAVDSVLAQTGPKLEIIVVDDGSSDETYEILRNYIDKGIITYYKQENKGPASARNLGIENSNGEFICFLDADDTLQMNSIQNRLSAFRMCPGFGLLFTDFTKIQLENGKSIVKSEKELEFIGFLTTIAKGHIRSVNGDVYLFDKGIFNELVFRCFIWTGTVIIPKNVFADIGFFDEELRIAEDHDLWLRIALKYEIAFLDKCTAEYVLHDGGITKNIPLYYDSSIKVRSRYLNALPPSFQKKIKNKLAYFSFVKGYYYYENRLYYEANRSFRQASSQNIYSFRYHLYLALTSLPERVINKLRNLKSYLTIKCS